MGIKVRRGECGGHPLRSEGAHRRRGQPGRAGREGREGTALEGRRPGQLGRERGSRQGGLGFNSSELMELEGQSGAGREGLEMGSESTFGPLLSGPQFIAQFDLPS